MTKGNFTRLQYTIDLSFFLSSCYLRFTFALRVQALPFQDSLLFSPPLVSP